MDVNSLFFKSLPVNIQKRYNKITSFYETMEDPNTRICPREGCEGLARLEIGTSIIRCENCNS